MEGDSHDPVRGVERLLHTVPVVDVNVDVQDPLREQRCLNCLFLGDDEGYLVILKQLKDGKDNVIDIAKAGCFALLCVMKSSRPVDCNVSCLNRRHKETNIAQQKV